MTVRLIAAVGRQGQLGLDGGLPWGSRFAEDRRRFRDLTSGGIVIVGRGTWASVMHLDNTYGRSFWLDLSRRATPEQSLDDAREMFGRNRDVWIAGGAHTYARFLHLIEEHVVTVLPFDGEADVWMPHLWEPKCAATSNSSTTPSTTARPRGIVPEPAPIPCSAGSYASI